MSGAKGKKDELDSSIDLKAAKEEAKAVVGGKESSETPATTPASTATPKLANV